MRKKQEEVRKTYNDFDWVQMFHEGTKSKLTAPVLTLFLDKHRLRHGKMKNVEKVNTINTCLANSEYHKVHQGVRRDEDNEISDMKTVNLMVMSQMISI